MLDSTFCLPFNSSADKMKFHYHMAKNIMDSTEPSEMFIKKVKNVVSDLKLDENEFDEEYLNLLSLSRRKYF